MVKVIEPVRAPEQFEDAAEPAGRNYWKVAQHVLAAASALPLLFWGGLHAWPWTDTTPAASVTPADPSNITPTHLEIGSVQIDAPIEPLSTDPDTGALDTPDYGQAGWYEAGPKPGAVGRAVILGHRVDSTGGDDVFATLDQVKAGDSIAVDTEGGSQLTFTVKSVKTYAIADVPADDVYGPSKTAQLRLVAPTGTDKDVIVFADRDK
jgi:LPXTG-site transpeptidase (sortase) family protein